MPFVINGTTGINLGTQPLTGSLPDANAPVGSVLQVVQAYKTDVFATSANDAAVAITGLGASITPLSTSSRILVIISVNYSGAMEVWPGITVSRDGGSSFVGSGDASGSRQRVMFGEGQTGTTNDNFRMKNGHHTFFDTPNTTSTLTYQVYINGRTGFGGTSVNRSWEDSNDTYSGKRGASSITLMEIAA